MDSYDDIVIGAGHNGLTAAAYLARAGRRVLVLERSEHVGGASVSAEPFPRVPARLSRYSYLVSLMPRRIMADLDLDIRLVRRRISSYTPLPHDPTRGILVDGGDEHATAHSFRAATGSDSDFAAWQRFYGRMAGLASRVFPTVLEPLRSAGDMRSLVDDDELFDALTTVPLAEILTATFTDDTVRGIVATDALIGTFADLGESSLRQNICLLYHLIGGGTGDWDVPVGGMGSVTSALARAASAAGADIYTSAEVLAVDPDARTVQWEGGSARSSMIHCACAPTVFDSLTAADPIATERAPVGAQLKINVLLTRLPRLLDTSVDPAAAFAGTCHINEGFDQLQAAYAAAARGELPNPVPAEIYCHTLSDRSILGADLGPDSQTLTVFALHLPPTLFDAPGSLERATEATLASLNSVLAEPLTDVIARDASGALCLEVKSPRDLEATLALPGGNIFHRSLQWPWAESDHDVGSWGVHTRYPGVVVCGAGARRGGGVSGIGGHNAAQAVLG